MSELQLTWHLTDKGKTVGNFKDVNGTGCVVLKAEFVDNAFVLGCSYGPMLLSPAMCAELGLVLGYIAFTDGKLPQAEADVDE